MQAGQTPGSSIGNLPEGYAPIPATWVTQAMNAASAIQAGIKPTKPVDLGSLPQGSYVPTTNVTSDDSTITAAGDISSLESDQTAADPNIGALAGAVPLSLLTGVASGLAVPLFTRARRRVEA